MSEKIKIDIVSDVVCPWCIVGYKRLEAAINELNLQDKVEIEWQPFELNSDMPKEGENLRDHVLRKYGAGRVDSDKARESIRAHGEEYNFIFDYFEEMKIVNTRDAHLLLDLARECGIQHNLKLRLFTAFFTEQKDVSDRKVLLEEAVSVGLDLEMAKAALESKERLSALTEHENEWQKRGVTGVPTMVFNQESGLTGAHPKETYIKVLKNLMSK
ncbi:MAG: putative DsbA family dithiol-disulfide isomerase [Bacteriovoracaceae bacterium]|jgi:predicted DsbA family dithiol-disulfide isomerase